MRLVGVLRGKGFAVFLHPLADLFENFAIVPRLTTLSAASDVVKSPPLPGAASLLLTALLLTAGLLLTALLLATLLTALLLAALLTAGLLLTA